MIIGIAVGAVVIVGIVVGVLVYYFKKKALNAVKVESGNNDVIEAK